MKYFRLTTSFVAMIALQAGMATAATVVISDETFADADWSVQFDGTVVSRLDPSGGVQFPIGGNPGAFREVTNAGFNFAAGGGAPVERILSWHLNTVQPYDLAIQGAIESISYSEDSIELAAPAQTGWLALKQDGLLFRSKQSYTIDSTGWTSVALPDLEVTDFEVLFDGNFLPTGNPDFSASGGSIEFGVLRQTLLGGRALPRARSGLDNWRVEVTQVIPEPTCVGLLIIGIAGACVLRRNV